MQSQAKQRADLGTDSEIAPIRRGTGALNLAAASAKYIRRLGRDGFPQLRLVGCSPETIKKISKWLQTALRVRRDILEVNWNAGKLAIPEIIRVALPPAPSAGPCLGGR